MLVEFTTSGATQVVIAVAQITALWPTTAEDTPLTVIELTDGRTHEVRGSYRDTAARIKEAMLAWSVDVGYATARAHREMLEAL